MRDPEHTQCSQPPALTEAQIDAYLAGEREDAVVDHLQQCTYCRMRVEQAQQVDDMLMNTLFRWDCPTSQQLGDYHLGILDETIAAQITDHLSYCVRCREELAELEAFLADDTVESTAAINTSAPVEPTHRDRLGAWESLGFHLQQVIAQFVPRTAAPALRGEAQNLLVAKAATLTIYLRWESAPGGYRLNGQLAAEDEATWRDALVQVWQAGNTIASAAVDDLLTFSCDTLPGGSTQVQITARDGLSILIPAFELGTAPPKP